MAEGGDRDRDRDRDGGNNIKFYSFFIQFFSDGSAVRVSFYYFI